MYKKMKKYIREKSINNYLFLLFYFSLYIYLFIFAFLHFFVHFFLSFFIYLFLITAGLAFHTSTVKLQK